MNFLSFSVLLAFVTTGTNTYMLGTDPTRRAEYLDTEETYLLEWEVLWSSGRIVFNVTVQTTGYVAFGLANSNNDAVEGGGVDFLIAGVMDHGRTYFLDNHIWGKGTPEVDLGQDYVLHTSWESRTHTFISFSRLLDTCDPQDYPITDNRVSVVWGYGEDDNHEVAWNGRKRGSFDLYLLDQDHSRRIERGEGGEPKVVAEEELGVWSIKRRTRIPSNETSYLCTMHRGPQLRVKHHVVGFDTHFPSDQSRQRVHQLIVFKCNVPQGLSLGIFEPFVGSSNGQPCYMNTRPSSPMPAHFCTEMYFGWGKGGRAFFLPPHVGLPLGSSPNEYYMVQVHYDNPEKKSNLIVDLRLEFFYTSSLRANEGGVMGIGHDIPGLAPSLLIPPNSRNHRVNGHCSPECTRRMFPDDGIKIFAGLLHTHNAGRRLRLRHFSNGVPVEQPWILYDDNYSNEFQHFRHLHVERSVLPGDQLTLECSYDTGNGSVVGGYGTSQEMCFSFVVYYAKILDYNVCTSEIVSGEYRDYFLGVGNVTWVEGQLDWVAVTPRSLAGYTVKQISDNFVDWDSLGRRSEMQRFHEVHPQVGKCSRDLYARSAEGLQALMRSGIVSGEVTGEVRVSVDSRDDFSGAVGYPRRVKGYVPFKSCSFGK